MSLADFLSGCRVVEAPPIQLAPGKFPAEDSTQNQAFLSIDFKSFKPKEAKFMQALLAGQNQTQAAISAGCPEAGAATQGSRMAQKLADDIESRMDAAGLTMDKLLKLHNELLEASTTRWDNKKQEFVKDVPDQAVRLNALKLAYQLRQLLGDQGARAPSSITVVAGVDRDKSRAAVRIEQG